MSDEWPSLPPRPYGLDPASRFLYGDDFIARANNVHPESAAYWATLTLKQKVVGSLCSIAVGAGGARLLIALATFLH